MPSLSLDDVPTINPEATAGAIYIVRNPLDVVVSYANQYDVSHDRAIKSFGSEGTIVPNHGPLVVQYLGNWSDHVRSWLDAPGLKPHLIRYEDMARKPDKAFRGVIKFLGLPLEVPASEEGHPFQLVRHARQTGKGLGVRRGRSDIQPEVLPQGQGR